MPEGCFRLILVSLLPGQAPAPVQPKEFSMRWTHPLARFCVCASALLVPFVAQAASEDDPWESINRPIYQFNDVLDTYALKPLAQGYQYVTPQFLEDGIH